MGCRPFYPCSVLFCFPGSYVKTFLPLNCWSLAMSDFAVKGGWINKNHNLPYCELKESTGIITFRIWVRDLGEMSTIIIIFGTIVKHPLCSSYKPFCTLYCASSCGSVVKDPHANAGDIRDSSSILGREDHLEKEMATHFSILARKIP